MAARRQRVTSLGSLETTVLEALWEHGALSTPDAHALVGVPRELAYTTILTVLQRLTQKGLVARRSRGRSHTYAPALSRDEFAALRGGSLATEFVAVGAGGVAAFLAEAERLDPELVQALRRRLRARR